MNQQIETIIFDLGGVLIDWNPRHLYQHIFRTSDAMEHFLSEVCTSHWNEEQDGGRSFEEATRILTKQFPHYSSEIGAFYGRWEEMLRGPIHGTVKILSEIRASGKYRIYALTNWSAESFPVALGKYEFIHWFDGILVSGDENMRKPDHKIFHLMLSRYNIEKSKALFIDDNQLNINAAKEVGLQTIHFKNNEQCKLELQKHITW
ncbi:MAG: HAD family phosphatase [Saprospiraceae bacterium]|nr:HAD family phosphatase [Saprospiraceae bacterium]